MFVEPRLLGPHPGGVLCAGADFRIARTHCTPPGCDPASFMSYKHCTPPGCMAPYGAQRNIDEPSILSPCFGPQRISVNALALSMFPRELPRKTVCRSRTRRIRGRRVVGLMLAEH